jgi:Ca-dependent carbohydrate-binding module xylan-binding/Glycosyl hydrolases family 39
MAIALAAPTMASAILLSGSTAAFGATPGPSPTSSTVLEGEGLSLPSPQGARVNDPAASGGQGLLIWTNGTATTPVSLPAHADTMVVRAKGDQCQGAPRMSVAVDGRQLLSTTVPATTWTDYRAPAVLSAGSHQVSVSFLNDYLTNNCDRNLYLDKLTLGLAGATPAPSPTPTPSPSATPTTTPSPTTTPTPGATPTPSPSTTIRVDFTSSAQGVDPAAFGMDVGGDYALRNIATDPSNSAQLRQLRLGLMRMELRYTTSGNSSSSIICGGLGCNDRVSGDEWIGSIRSSGGEPVVIVPFNKVDAANLVRHFNLQTNSRVERWIVWNEPDNQGVSANDYATNFNSICDAMKAVDPTIKVGGPAIAWYSGDYMQAFLNISGSRVDFIDYHTYGNADVTDSADMMRIKTVRYENDIKSIRQQLQTTLGDRASSVSIEVGEWNIGAANDERAYNQFSTVWGASVMGHILKAGGLGIVFSDKNGGQGALYDRDDPTHGGHVDDPMPIYHGLGMFTGEGLFRAFGTSLATVVTPFDDIEVYASRGAMNIVVINKSSTTKTTTNVSLNGADGGIADAWLKDSSSSSVAPPIRVEQLNVTSGHFVYSFPPYSVTTFVLHG